MIIPEKNQIEMSMLVYPIGAPGLKSRQSAKAIAAKNEKIDMAVPKKNIRRKGTFEKDSTERNASLSRRHKEYVDRSLRLVLEIEIATCRKPIQ